MITLTKDQQNVLDDIKTKFINGQHCCLNAPAGTGKTTIVDHLCNDLDQKFNIILTATTHKAAEVLEAKTGRETMTIHSAMRLQRSIDYKTGLEKFIKSKDNDLIQSGDIVVVDEASMIPSSLFRMIVDMIKDIDVTVLFVGDSKQLNPVKEQLSSALLIPNTFTLTEIIRTDNSIVACSEFIRNCVDNVQRFPVDALKEFKDINVFDNSRSFQESMNNDPDHVFLCWRNITALNEAQRYRGFLGHQEDIITPGEEIVLLSSIVVNKKVIAKNNTKHVVKKCSKRVVKGVAALEIETSLGVKFNTAIDFQPVTAMLSELAEEAKMDSNWRTYYSTKDSFIPITFAHTMTIHKSQGSDIKNVYIDADDIMLNSDLEEMLKLFYVGVSRGIKSVNILRRV